MSWLACGVGVASLAGLGSGGLPWVGLRCLERTALMCNMFASADKVTLCIDRKLRPFTMHSFACMARGRLVRSGAIVAAAPVF